MNQPSCLRRAILNRDLVDIFLVSLSRLFQIPMPLELNALAKNVFLLKSVKLKQMYRQNIRDVPTNHIKNVMFYS